MTNNMTFDISELRLHLRMISEQREEKMFKKGTCPLCGGHKKSGKTIFTVALGEGILVVRDVPALISNP